MKLNRSVVTFGKLLFPHTEMCEELTIEIYHKKGRDNQLPKMILLNKPLQN